MYFRADKRQFETGDVIESAAEFSKLNPPGSQDIESIFERVRPSDKPPRMGSLFLFKDERAARKHWSKMTGGNLYLATVAATCSAHEYDMRLIEEAFNRHADSAAVEAIAIRYWNGDITADPIVEVLVPSATISSVISKDQQERKEYFTNWAIRGSAERT